MTVVADSDCQDLFDVETNVGNIKLAMLVVNLDKTFSNLIWHEDVLVEDAAHGGGTLINTAPCLDIAGL